MYVLVRIPYKSDINPELILLKKVWLDNSKEHVKASGVKIWLPTADKELNAFHETCLIMTLPVALNWQWLLVSDKTINEK